MSLRIAGVLVTVASFGSNIALADESLVPIAEKGSWIAFAHRDSMVDRPDVCAATEINSHFAIRADANDVEVRLVNETWSLPADVTGTIVIKVGADDYDLDIGSNTDKMVAAVIPQDKVVPLLDAAAKASLMTVLAGKGKPISVSLSGSSTVLNAFRTCAGISGSAVGGGANPFQ